MAQIIVVTLLVLAFAWAIYRTFLKKGGMCEGCCGGCHGCKGSFGKEEAKQRPRSPGRCPGHSCCGSQHRDKTRDRSA